MKFLLKEPALVTRDGGNEHRNISKLGRKLIIQQASKFNC